MQPFRLLHLTLLCLAIALISSCASTVVAPSRTEGSEPPVMTLEALKASFAITIPGADLSANDLYLRGRQYETGTGVLPSYALALAYYQAAEKAGNRESREAIQALATMKARVLAASPGGQGELFTFYRKGVVAGQAGDYQRAYAIFFDDAFFFDDTKGIGSLADLLLEGKGVAQDVTRALAIYDFFARGLRRGSGYTSIGRIYAAKSGTYPGFRQSHDTALGYFLSSYQTKELQSIDFKGPRLAADYFDAGYVHDDGTTQPPDYLKAEQGYLLASQGNGVTFDGTACYKLGTYYEQGRPGISTDATKAVEYYKKAVSDPNVHSTMLGIPQTYLALGRFYEKGLGVSVDRTMAKDFYNKAASAAQDNLNLEFAAGKAEAGPVLREATEALTRLGN